MKFVKLVILIIVLFYIQSCNITTSVNEHTQYEIKDILSKIEVDFNFGDIDSLTVFISHNFSHKGRDYNQEIGFWNDLFYQYTNISIKNIEVQRFSYEKAKAVFDLTLSNNTETIELHEPSDDFGDLSFFIYENSKWKLIGKDNFK